MADVWQKTGEKRGKNLRVYQLMLVLQITREGKLSNQPKQAIDSCNRSERCLEQKQASQFTGV